MPKSSNKSAIITLILALICIMAIISILVCYTFLWGVPKEEILTEAEFTHVCEENGYAVIDSTFVIGGEDMPSIAAWKSLPSDKQTQLTYVHFPSNESAKEYIKAIAGTRTAHDGEREKKTKLPLYDGNYTDTARNNNIVVIGYGNRMEIRDIFIKLGLGY